MKTDFFPQLWIATLTCQLKFLELPAQEARESDDFLEVDLEESGFQASFAKLHTAARTTRDPWSSIPDPKAYLVDQLNRDTTGQFAPTITANLPEALPVLATYGVKL